MTKPLPKLPELPLHESYCADGGGAACRCEPWLGYIRVSKVGRREVLISPDIQLDYIVADARRKRRRIVELHFDIDRSGRTFRRRSVDRCIQRIKSGRAKGLIIWQWSRFGRSVEWSKYYVRLVRQAGGRVESATEDINQDTAMGKFQLTVIMGVDELKSDQIAEGWQSAHDHRRSQGLPHAGRPRFGYVYHPATREHGAHYEPHPVEAKALERLYRDYIGGVSLRQLARDLNAAGLRTTRGGQWTPQAVGVMLDTGFGAGLIRERSDEKLAADRAKQEDGKWVRTNLACFDSWREGAHPAVIDRATWDKYHARRLEQAGRPPRARTAAHALSALLYCHECARRLVTKYSGAKRQHQWMCPWQETYHPTVAVSVSNAAALRAVRSWVHANAQPPSGPSPDEIARRAVEDAAAPSQRGSAQIKAEIARARKKLDRLLDMTLQEDANGDPLVDPDTYRIKKAEIEGEVAGLKAELDALNELPTDGGRPAYEAFGALDEQWELQDTATLNAALSRVIGYVIVSPANGVRRWHNGVEVDQAARVEVVGRWAADSKERWLSARRVNLAA